MGSSKRKSELKGKVTSIRLSQEQHESVKTKAEAKGMSLSNYIITSAVNGGNNISPDLLVKIQNLTNTACTIAEKYSPEAVDSLQKGANEIWHALK